MQDETNTVMTRGIMPLPPGPKTPPIPVAATFGAAAMPVGAWTTKGDCSFALGDDAGRLALRRP
jgi:hypothetical protein